MKTENYIKVVLTLIAVFLGIIATALVAPSAQATRRDSETGMEMVRVCEREHGSINCVDITSGFAMKVELSDTSIRRLAQAVGR
jgi:hypothetical protein